jgi:prohibitin 1
MYLVPLAIGVALLQSSLYDVPGGFKAVMFDRFSGVKDQVCSGHYKYGTRG